MQTTSQSTVVITGASSGIGRATAEAFAREGARLVLAARRADALEEVAAACRALGAATLVLPTDVTDGDAVGALARAAAEFGGGIDVWVNNAGVGAVGLLEDVPIAANEQVVRVNLLGYIHGAHAALPYFKRRGRGVLVNNISLGAWAPTPYAVAYTASKYGLRGFSEALRSELTGWPDIHVCDVFPSVVDTPGFLHGGNYTGKALRPPRPLYDARRVADAIVRAAREPWHGTVPVGAVAVLARVGNQLAPSLVRRGMALVFGWYFRHAKDAPRTDGNLLEPRGGVSTIDGGWRARQRQRVTSGAVVLGAAGLALAMLVRRR